MRTARKVLLTCLMLIVGIMFFGEEYRVKAYAYYEIDVELGYDNQAKYGRYIPVKMDIFSQEDFSGTISVKRIASDGSTQISTYPVEIEGPGSQTVYAQMPLFDKNREFVFILKDSKGDEVKQKRQSVDALNSDYTELFVGVVDEEGIAKPLFDQINLGEYSNTAFPYVLTKAVTLEPSQIMGDFEYTLDCIDIIVITESSMQSLTEENIECLLGWTAAGNILIIEYTDIISPYFAEIAGEAFNKRQAEDEVLRPGIWIFGLGYGEGRIGFFTSLENSSFISFAASNQELIGMLLNKNCSYDVINDIIDYDLYYANSDDTYAVQYMLNTAVGKETPDIKRYIAVIALYIVLVGPVLYLILRKKNRVRFILPVVLVMAAVFSCAINEMGKSTRFTDMFLQYASVINIGDDEINETTYMCANVPYKDTYYMKFSNDYNVMKLSELVEAGAEETEALENKESVEIVYTTDADTKLILENKVPFSRTYLEAKRKHDDYESWQLDVNITYYDGVFMGSVTNISNKDYKQLAVIMCGKIVILGDLKAGESIEVYDAEVVTLPYYSNDAANRILGFDRLREEASYDSGALLEEMNGKAGIVEYVLNKYFSTQSTTPVIIGFTDDRDGAFQFDDRYETFGFTMIYKEIEVNTSIGNMIYRPLTYSDIENLDNNSNYDAYSNTTYSSMVRLQYRLNNAKTLVRIVFDHDDKREDNYYGTFSGATYFYNYETLTYDEVDISKEYFYVSELEQYLKQDGNTYILTVQYNVNTTGQYRYTEVKLPDVATIRRDIYAESTEP